MCRNEWETIVWSFQPKKWWSGGCANNFENGNNMYGKIEYSNIWWVPKVQMSKLAPSLKMWTLMPVHLEGTGEGIICCRPKNEDYQWYYPKSPLTAIGCHYLWNLRVWVARMTTYTSKSTEAWVKFKIQDRPIMKVFLDEISILQLYNNYWPFVDGKNVHDKP